MAVKKTHVKSGKRQQRERDEAAVKDASKKKFKKKAVLGKKQKTVVQSGFRFKSQSERYKDISVDLKSLLEDAVERYGRYDVQEKDQDPEEMVQDQDEELEEPEEDMISTPMSTALAELSLLNTSIPFQSLHRILYPITRSLPLILHHRLKIANSLIITLTTSNRVDLALSASHTIDLIPAFVQSLSPDPDFQLLDFETVLTPLMRALVAVALDPPSVSSTLGGDKGNDPNSQTEISKRAFQVLAWTLREIGGDLVNKGDFETRGKIAWSWVREGLQGGKPEVHVDVAKKELEKSQEELPEEDEEDPPLDEPEAMLPESAEMVVEQQEEAAEPEAVDAEAEDVEQEGEAEESSETDQKQSGRAHRPLSATKPHLRRLLATCFAFLVRKAKSGSPLDSLARIIFDALDDDSTEGTAKLTQSIAWIVVESAKSVETHIHSRGPALLKSFIAQALRKGSQTKSRLLEAALTALVHHSRVETFGGISEIIIRDFARMVEKEAVPPAQQHLTLQLVGVLVGTRKGGRLTDTDKANILSACETYSQRLSSQQSLSLLQTFVEVATKALLIAPNLECMLSTGRKVLERIWQLPQEYFPLAAASMATLSEQKWPYFADFALPMVSSHQQRSQSSAYLSLLTRLADDGNLPKAEIFAGQITGTVADKLQTWIQTWKNGKATERQGRELLDCLQLCSQMKPNEDLATGLLSSIRAVVSAIPSSESAKADFAESPINAAAVLAAALQTLSAAQTDQSVAADDILTILQKFGWHRSVASALAAILKENDQLPSMLALLPLLTEGMLSEDSLLRSSALDILALASPESGILQRCVEVEQTPLTVQDAREKASHLRRLGIAMKNAEAKSAELTIAFQYTLAMLKVNFKPLWIEAIASITEAVREQKAAAQETVWELLRAQLASAARQSDELLTVAKPAWGDAAYREEAGAATDTLSQGEFRCTSHQRIQKTLVSREAAFSGRGVPEASSDPIVLSQITEDRLVISNYELQLLQLCASIGSLTEKHSRDFVTIFFAHFGDQSEDSGDGGGGRVGRARLAAWLEVFTKFKNPKALYQSEDLHAYHLATLSHGDATLQALALDCILTWKSPSLLPHAEHLRNLLNDTKFRDQLLHFSLAEDSDAILPSRRNEVVPITIRILYGLMSSRQGRASATHVQAGRKAAVLAALRTCSPQELNTLVDLMLAPFEDQSSQQPDGFAFSDATPAASTSRQVGFLSLLADVLKHLSSKLRHRWNELLAVTLNLSYHSQPATGESDGSTAAPKRRVRQLALRRLAEFFSIDPAFSFAPYLAPLFKKLISPRLPTFAAENAQAPSAILELIVCWTSDASLTHILVDYDAALLPALYACLSISNVKNTVVSKVLLLVQRLLAFASQEEFKEKIQNCIIVPYITPLLENLAHLLGKKAATINVRDELGMRQIAILSDLAPYIADKQSASLFLPILLPLFRKPNAILPEKIKTELLQVLGAVIPLALSEEQAKNNDTLYEQAFEAVSTLYAGLRTRLGRTHLVSAFAQFAKLDHSLSQVTGLLQDLNSFSTRRLEEPDFNRRLPAFARLNETEYRNLTAQQWIPIIHTMFYFIQDPEELSIRSNANMSLRKFVDIAGASLDPEMRKTFSKTFLPRLKSGLKSKTEMVRIEIVSVLSAAVLASTGVAELEEMKCLLAGGDSEANFFNNIYHVQVHRRGRAMRRLADEAEAGHISSSTIADLFLPLLGHNLTSVSENKHAELINDTVQCIGRVSQVLQWSAYHRTLQLYLKLAKEGREGQKVFVRTSVAVLRAFHFDLAASADGKPSALHGIVTYRLLPRLMQFLETRDDAEEAMRIPMAEGIAVVIQHLPEDDKTSDVSSLITALAQILRSKSQDVRDFTRATLVNIAVALGPTFFGTVVRELKASLARGPQLHVLAFTLHVLLVRMTASNAGVNLDSSLDSAVPIIYDDMFGQPSKDRESQEFRAKTKVREVRSSKSLDSIEMLARNVSPDCINKLLGPLRDIIADTESHKTMRDVDDTMRHLAVGLQANSLLDAPTLLSICQGLISQNTDFLKPRKQKRGKGKQAAADYLVQLKRPNTNVTDHYAQNAHRFVSFGLDLLNGAFRKNKFDLQNKAIVSRLDPLITLVGNTLFAEEGHILERALRAVASLIRCPLGSIDRAAPVLVKQMISILEHTGGTSSELAQTAIRTMANIIRDRKSLVLKDEQLAFLVSVISPDLEETEQQPALFSLLRSITSRTFVVPEIYDLMDRVAEILVTNQTSGTREICRSIYLQFLLDYPQGKKRLSASLEFLAKNLGGYLHESGRTSALELVNAILSKFTVKLLDEYANLFFVSLTMAIANDQSSRCREMSAENLKVLIGRVSQTRRDQLAEMTFAWAKAEEQRQLVRVSVQVLGLFLEALQNKSEMDAIAKQVLLTLTDALEGVALRMEEEEENDIDGEDTGAQVTKEVDWQIPYQALQSLSRLFRVSPSSLSATSRILWQSVRILLLYPHVWVRNAAARLLGVLFASDQSITVPDLIDAASKSATQLRSKLLDETLSMQVIKNLFYVGKQFVKRGSSQRNGSNGTAYKEGGYGSEEDDEEEDEEEEEGETADAAQPDPTSDPLHWLFVKLSHRARVAHQTRPSMYSSEGRAYKWSLEPASIFRWFGAMISEPTVDVAHLDKQKLQMLIPIVRVIEDPNGAKDPQLEELQTLAREVQELLSQKIGVTSVAETYSEIRRKMSMRREERKRATALAAVNDPEIDAKRRAKRTESKAKAKKRKNASYADNKMRYGMKGGSGSKRARTD